MLSQSEITDIAKKAARGVGYSWGMAEDAAFGTLALIQNGHDGLAILCEWLEMVDQTAIPDSADCVLHQGAYMADLGQVPDNSAHALTRALSGHLRAAEQPTDWPTHAPQALVDFAARVYVMESDESQARGAGA